MKQFGTVTSFDDVTGQGSLRPATGDAELPFERSAFAWGVLVPKLGARIAYDFSTKVGQSGPINLETF